MSEAVVYLQSHVWMSEVFDQMTVLKWTLVELDLRPKSIRPNQTKLIIIGSIIKFIRFNSIWNILKSKILI